MRMAFPSQMARQMSDLIKIVAVTAIEHKFLIVKVVVELSSIRRVIPCYPSAVPIKYMKRSTIIIETATTTIFRNNRQFV